MTVSNVGFHLRLPVRFTITLVFAVVIAGCMPCYICGSSGDWRCSICNKFIEKNEFLGISQEDKPGDSPYFAGASFEEWYWRNVGIEHVHDWTAVGCHRDGAAWSCCFGGRGGEFYSSLPSMPDQELAISMARRIALASHEDRTNLLESFSRPYGSTDWKEAPPEDKQMIGNGEPWRLLSEGKNLSKDDFMRYYQVWLKYHPEWR